MRVQLILLTALLQTISPALADRGNAPDIPPVVCNALPDDTGSPPPTCIPVVDVMETTCKELLESGWCDCGTGLYPVLTSGPDQPCGYASLDGVGVLNLKSCETSITLPLVSSKTKTRGIFTSRSSPWSTLSVSQETTSGPNQIQYKLPSPNYCWQQIRAIYWTQYHGKRPDRGLQ
jgi:hypothetical protein